MRLVEPNRAAQYKEEVFQAAKEAIVKDFDDYPGLRREYASLSYDEEIVWKRPLIFRDSKIAQSREFQNQFAAPRMRDPQHEIVRIEVSDGNDENPYVDVFYVHKALICHYSSHFNAAFNDRAEVVDGIETIAVSGTSKEVFGRYVEWIYTQELRDTSRSALAELDQDEMEEREAVERGYKETIESLIDLWILAEFTFVPGLQNLVIDALEYHRGWLHSIGSVRLNELSEKVHRLASEGTKLRRYFISALTVSVANRHLELPDCPAETIDAIQQFLDSASASDDLFVDQYSMRTREAMMQYYAEDPEMPLPPGAKY
ncbi:hypothetical protein DSL72_001042 [Monilinia vaccinii-corymbosi]|uniref:BTB domain-containing protein n=1 Tax=Monilinia vaccinii-corymbosi TaxID=61207 RepID=A0A8A3PAH6_9HELO|nr:hypothetical protein DSL72_001042 [Monilinia vaccinii-corymbosi]